MHSWYKYYTITNLQPKLADVCNCSRRSSSSNSFQHHYTKMGTLYMQSTNGLSGRQSLDWRHFCLAPLLDFSLRLLYVPFLHKNDKRISSQSEPPPIVSLFLLPAMSEGVDSHCLCSPSNWERTFGTKHGGRCLHINIPAKKTLHVDISCVFFSQ